MHAPLSAEEAVSGRKLQVRTWSETGMLGNFGVASRVPSSISNFKMERGIKGVNYRFALKDGTWDFPGDSGNFRVPLE